jgi:hypothetical protein
MMNTPTPVFLFSTYDPSFVLDVIASMYSMSGRIQSIFRGLPFVLVVT